MLRVYPILVAYVFVGAISIPVFILFMCNNALLPFYLRRIHLCTIFTHIIRSSYLFYTIYSFLTSHTSTNLPNLLFSLTYIRLKLPSQIAHYLYITFTNTLSPFIHYLYLYIIFIYGLYFFFFLIHQPYSLESP